MSLHGPTLMPTESAATIHTDQLVNGDTGLQIQCCVRQKEATAFPAAPRMSWGVLFHPPTVHLLAGELSTGKISRGKLAAGRCPSDGKREV